jgi:hypothetical protein
MEPIDGCTDITIAHFIDPGTAADAETAMKLELRDCASQL